MFLNIDKRRADSEALVDSDGCRITYGDLTSFVGQFYQSVGGRCLMVILTENCAAAAAGYAAAMCSRVVPLMLSHTLSSEALERFVRTYRPAFLFVPEKRIEEFPCPVCLRAYGYALLKTGLEPWPMAEELSLLLPTSGSTGSPKLVRHSYDNVESNARAVAEVFQLDAASRGMVSLPLNFTQGLNVATSHLAAGGTALLTRASLTEKTFWTFFRQERAQSFTGVPYSYEILNRIRFFRMDLPHLKIINQGGGRLPDHLFDACVSYARDTGRKFIATYGSTETTSRMAWLPAELAAQKRGSIGRPLPGRSMTIVDEDGNRVEEPGKVGEIVFRGPNVTLGYAECGDDLMKGDERHGVYATGDLAWRDADGCFYIVGRRNRFLKLYGFRVGLDETERQIKDALQISCACVGDDKQMRIYVEKSDEIQRIPSMLSACMGIPSAAFQVIEIERIPKNETGKTIYAQLK